MLGLTPFRAKSEKYGGSKSWIQNYLQVLRFAAFLATLGREEQEVGEGVKKLGEVGQ